MQAETKVRFDIDQATLGGEAVSAIRLEAARSSGTLLLKDLRAGLPGGAKLTLDGTIADVANARSFRAISRCAARACRASSPGSPRTTASPSSCAAMVPFSLQGRFSA